MIKTAVALLIALSYSMSGWAQTYGATTKIWQQRSMYRNIIVLEGNGHRCLTFGKRSARQSCIETENPEKLIFGYTQRIFEALQYIPNMKRILIIGIGGGTLPMAIRKAYPTVDIDAVELDAEVIQVAERFFQFKPDRKLNVFAEDGRVFIRKAIRREVTYDAIILDAFDKDYIPEHMATAECLTQVKMALTSNGVLLANTFHSTSFAPFEEATYQHVFGEVFESRIQNGNRIIITGNGSPAVAARVTDSQRLVTVDAQVMTDRFSPANALLIH